MEEVALSYLMAILMGIIQGVAEFLPISSSGHLALFQQFFGMENRPAAYALAGAATAVVLCFILLKLRRNGRSNP